MGGASQAPVSLADMMPKVDISGQIKSSMISELGDKNWKVRGEALQQVQCMCMYNIMHTTCTCVVCCVIYSIYRMHLFSVVCMSE